MQSTRGLQAPRAVENILREAARHKQLWTGAAYFPCDLAVNNPSGRLEQPTVAEETRRYVVAESQPGGYTYSLRSSTPGGKTIPTFVVRV